MLRAPVIQSVGQKRPREPVHRPNFLDGILKSTVALHSRLKEGRPSHLFEPHEMRLLPGQPWAPLPGYHDNSAYMRGPLPQPQVRRPSRGER